jgi:hypothetical protein
MARQVFTSYTTSMVVWTLTLIYFLNMCMIIYWNLNNIHLIDDSIYKVISIYGKYYQLYVPWIQLIFKCIWDVMHKWCRFDC